MDFYQEIPFLVEQLQQGELILYPTDTIWGIGCDATNIDAIHQIDVVKQRAIGKHYVLLMDSYDMLEEYIAYIPLKARNLIDYHSRPLTIVYDEPLGLPKEILAGDGSIAIRITKDPFCQEVIQSFGKPIVSTSANISGQPFPTCFADIDMQIKTAIKGIAKHRQQETVTAVPSTIVKVEEGKDLIFIRK